MTPTARALACTTGDPALKLVLLCVAACPGWPTAVDIAAAAEVPDYLAVAALEELTRRRLVTAHTATDATRYGLPEDGWVVARVETPEEAPADESLAALERGDIGGYSITGRPASRRVQA